MGLKNKNKSMEFDDVLEIPHYLVDSISSLIESGIVKGSGNKINPLQNATRAESVILIYRILNLIDQ